MIELDDLSQLYALDRDHLLVRAGQVSERWPLAQAAFTAFSAQHDLAQFRISNQDTVTTLSIVLILPPELVGIGRAVRSLCHQSAGLPLRLNLVLWDPDLHPGHISAPALWLSAVPPATLHQFSELNTFAPLLDLSPFISADQHPAQVFLFLLALLDQWSPEPALATAATASLDQLSALMATWTPGIPTAQNQAKQLAIQLHERLPFFWGAGPLAAIAEDWRLRRLWYAEAMAWAAPTDELVRIQVMARLPRYWFNIVTFVHLTSRLPNYSLISAEAKLDRLFTIRRLSSLRVTTPDELTLAGALWYYLELGEWLALYAAALYNVEPAERVPLQFLQDGI